MRSALATIATIAVFGGLAGALAVGCQSSSDVSRAVGARCDGDGECDQRCLTPSTTYPGGFCTVACNTRDDCPDRSTCADRDGGICLFECASDPDCEFMGSGWQCLPVDLHGGGIKVMVCTGS